MRTPQSGSDRAANIYELSCMGTYSLSTVNMQVVKLFPEQQQEGLPSLDIMHFNSCLDRRAQPSTPGPEKQYLRLPVESARKLRWYGDDDSFPLHTHVYTNPSPFQQYDALL